MKTCECEGRAKLEMGASSLVWLCVMTCYRLHCAGTGGWTRDCSQHSEPGPAWALFSVRASATFREGIHAYKMQSCFEHLMIYLSVSLLCLKPGPFMQWKHVPQVASF